MPKPGKSNNLLGDLPVAAKARRDGIEDALASLYRCLVDLDELALRIDQAARRAAVVAPVLHPAQERLQQIRQRIAAVHNSLGEYWSQGQAHRWE
jgi:hypothetical protein